MSRFQKPLNDLTVDELTDTHTEVFMHLSDVRQTWISANKNMTEAANAPRDSLAQIQQLHLKRIALVSANADYEGVKQVYTMLTEKLADKIAERKNTP